MLRWYQYKKDQKGTGCTQNDKDTDSWYAMTQIPFDSGLPCESFDSLGRSLYRTLAVGNETDAFRLVRKLRFVSSKCSFQSSTHL